MCACVWRYTYKELRIRVRACGDLSEVGLGNQSQLSCFIHWAKDAQANTELARVANLAHRFVLGGSGLPSEAGITVRLPLLPSVYMGSRTPNSGHYALCQGR